MSVDSTSLKVAFRRFYPGFDPSSFWLPLFSHALNRSVQVVRSKKAELVVTSVFESYGETWKRRLLTHPTQPRVPNKSVKANDDAKHLWLTGENLRPPLYGYDLTVSFDIDPFGGTNIYFPLMFEFLSWHQYWASPTWASETSRGAPRLDASSISEPRESAVSSRSKFLCAFIGNPEPTRLRAIEALSRHGKVDVFGSAFGRPVSRKTEIAKDYRFMLAFENDVFPGYVTEKVLEAYACGCVPLWWGDDAAHLINPTAIVNARDFKTLDDFADYVGNLDKNDQKLDQMASSPLLSATPSLDNLIGALGQIMQPERH